MLLLCMFASKDELFEIQATKAYKRMDTDKAKERLEEVKERYNLGGDLEKEKKERLGYTPTPGR